MSSLAHVGFERAPAFLSLVYGTAKRRPASRIYKPLPPGSIRLLKLLPAADDDDADPIAVRLETVRLEDAGPYDVLSYVWGDAAKDDKAILLHGVGMRVTTSLFSALRRFRDAWAVRTLWIDALCVDQTDLADRSQHAGLVPGIYTRAEQVIMWSGEAGDANAGMLFKRAKARHEAAKHKRLLERPLEALPVLECGEGSELVRRLVGVGDRVFGLGWRPRGELVEAVGGAWG